MSIFGKNLWICQITFPQSDIVRIEGTCAYRSSFKIYLFGWSWTRWNVFCWSFSRLGSFPDWIYQTCRLKKFSLFGLIWYCICDSLWDWSIILGLIFLSWIHFATQNTLVFGCCQSQSFGEVLCSRVTWGFQTWLCCVRFKSHGSHWFQIWLTDRFLAWISQCIEKNSTLLFEHQRRLVLVSVSLLLQRP